MAELGSLWAGPVDDPRRYRVDLGAQGLVSVGVGGEGLVYEAIGSPDDPGRRVALKMLTSLGPSEFDRVAARAGVLAGIDHPHIVKHLETFLGCPLVDDEPVAEDDFSVVYSVAEWVEGEPLAAAVEREGPARGLRWVAEVARAVAYLHAHRGPGSPEGIIHRDVKPSNVRVTPRGGAVLMDFGMARPHAPGDHTADTGTHLWRAPEVLGGPGKPGPASDVWGVGALAYWVILGEPPRFEGSVSLRERLARAARDQDLPEPLAISRRVAALLDMDPANRPRDLARWADRVDELLESARWPLGGRRRALTALVGCCGLIGAGVLVGIALTGSPRRVPSSVMARTETPESWPGGRVGRNLPIGRGRHVDMKCWTVGPPTDGSRKWFYVEADQFPYDEGYVPANSVAEQTAVGLCAPWTSPSSSSTVPHLSEWSASPHGQSGRTAATSSRTTRSLVLRSTSLGTRGAGGRIAPAGPTSGTPWLSLYG